MATAPTSISSTGSATTPNTYWPPPRSLPPRVRPDVVGSFITPEHHGLPAATLTDNGSVYPCTDSPTAIANSNCYCTTAGHHPSKRPPGHPQTQGKIERFHNPQKRWLPHDLDHDLPTCKPHSTPSAPLHPQRHTGPTVTTTNPQLTKHPPAQATPPDINPTDASACPASTLR